MLKAAQVKAVTRSPAVYRVKYADNYPWQSGGPNAPAIPPPQYGPSRSGTGA
jgi:hypothetical protein